MAGSSPGAPGVRAFGPRLRTPRRAAARGRVAAVRKPGLLRRQPRTRARRRLRHGARHRPAEEALETSRGHCAGCLAADAAGGARECRLAEDVQPRRGGRPRAAVSGPQHGRRLFQPVHAMVRRTALVPHRASPGPATRRPAGRSQPRSGTLGRTRGGRNEADPGQPHVGRFADLHEVGDAAIAAGLKDPVLDTDHIVLEYPDVRGLLHDLKGLGATNADRDRRRGLTGRSRFRAMVDAYERERRDGKIPASWEVVTLHAWGMPEGAMPLYGGRETRFEVIKRREPQPHE